MSISKFPISYCANVHPGETFAKVLQSLERYSAPLRSRLACPLAVGLWMTRNAVGELSDDPSLADGLARWLYDHDLLCYTMNAFPLGNFHARRVKENVYLPDWTTTERRDYTCRVADLLVRLLTTPLSPPGRGAGGEGPSEGPKKDSTLLSPLDGSISTSPCAFAPFHPSGVDLSIYFPKLCEVAQYLAQLRQRTGRTIRLAIEPEPCCVLETTDQTIRFFHDLWSYSEGRPEERAVREHLGICFDICHLVIQFEDVADSIRRLDREGIRINKIHITCALELRDPQNAEARRYLSRFVEERYLHQTFGRHPDGRLLSITDLSTEHALQPPSEWLECPTWRIHFHVPVHESSLGPLLTTRPVLEEALQSVRKLDYAPHLEVETYTWNVLPTDEASSEQFDLVHGLQLEMESTLKMIANLTEKSAYERLGVSATKTEVHEAVAQTDPGLFPGAFCRIGEDILGDDPDWCCALHADCAGTKTLVAYLLYRQIGDPTVFRGIAQDALVMNLDDLACIGATNRFLLANTISRNSFYIPGEVLHQIIAGYQDCIGWLSELGIEILATGGETGDLVDSVRTLVVEATLAVRLRRAEVIDNRRIRAGDVIVGLSSTGRASYEESTNSGIGANGLTLARHVLLSKTYADRYPETIEPAVGADSIYRGSLLLEDEPTGLGMSIGEALISPTRTYVPILKKVLDELRSEVHGIVHNTGGGLTKSKNFGEGIAYHKDNLFATPPLFRLIAEIGEIPWQEMYQTFNMGHRMELMVPPAAAETVIAISQSFSVDAQTIGRCEAADENSVIIDGEHGRFSF